MHNFLNHSTILALGILLLIGCDDSINPFAPFQSGIVAYSVLSSQSDTQYVRLYATYKPEDNNPMHNQEENNILDASVSITDGTNTYSFQYNSIVRPDTTRYKGLIGLYQNYSFRLQPSKEYTLKVISPAYGSIIAKTIVPGSGFIHSSSEGDLGNGATRSPIEVQYNLNKYAKAYLIRLFIIFTAENSNEPLETRFNEKYYEVPVFETIDLIRDEHTRIFPTVVTAPLEIDQAQRTVRSYLFQYPAYNESIYQILYGYFNLRFKRAIFYLVQFNEPWSKYYTSSHLPLDKYGVRLEPPFYTNIQGGAGMFGALQIDSTVVQLPERMVRYRQ